MTSIVAYDSAAPLRIPPSAGAILPYSGDSGFPWGSLARRWPHARYRWITTGGNVHLASIFDVENGAISVSHIRNLVKWRNEIRPKDKTIVYCNRSTVAAVQSACHGLDWHLFLATLDGSRPRSWNGKPTIAVQYWGGGSAPYDLSEWWDENDLHRGPALP